VFSFYQDIDPFENRLPESKGRNAAKREQLLVTD
jgi:hypothetical protein